jgi:hypothetical protein
MAVNEYRQLFLIDKSGKLTWGLSLDPPSEEQFEKLLKQAPGIRVTLR